jgi:hypothetical protein
VIRGGVLLKIGSESGVDCVAGIVSVDILVVCVCTVTASVGSAGIVVDSIMSF